VADEAALRRTLERRPDLIDEDALSREQQDLLDESMTKETGNERDGDGRKGQMTERPAMKSGDTVKVHVKVRRATRSASRSSRAS
jgi:hypothetical protein